MFCCVVTRAYPTTGNPSHAQSNPEQIFVVIAATKCFADTSTSESPNYRTSMDCSRFGIRMLFPSWLILGLCRAKRVLAYESLRASS